MMRSIFHFSTFCLMCAMALIAVSNATGQTTSLRSLHHANMPPGMIGRQQLLRSPAMPGYFQAVEIQAPEGVRISPIADGQLIESQAAPVQLGMQIGYVYQLKVTKIPLQEGAELYPTIELINRLYPPEGTKLRFPVPIELTSEDIHSALKGQYITRVIYLEDPDTALPQMDDLEHQRVIEVGPREDPLHVADRFGRPMAILRMGSRIPDDEQLFGGLGCGSPPIQIYPPPKKRARVSTTPQSANQAIERHGENVPRIDEPAINRSLPPATNDQP